MVGVHGCPSPVGFVFDCPKLVLGVLFLLAWIFAAKQTAAQPVQVFYDLAGNQVSMSPGAAGAPALVSPPQPQLQAGNFPVTFSVVASGVGLSYQWLSNGVPIPGANSDSLMVGASIVPGLGSYAVVVGNASGSITSAPAAIWPDSKGSGMPDWWQLRCFGDLTQAPTGDFDGDGVSNLDEYLEGTNPTNAVSFNPRLILTQTPLGSIVPSPDLPYYALGQVVTLTAIPAAGQQFLGWGGAVGGLKPVVSLVMDGHKMIHGVFGLPLPLALDNSNFRWTTGGDAPWFGQTDMSEDGMGSAQSGLISYNQKSWLQASVSLGETAKFSFWWNVSSQSPDQLSFSMDGAVVATISGEAESWRQVQTNLAVGGHTLLWTYQKGVYDVPTSIPFVDAGWVDQVVLTLPPPKAPPVFSQVTIINGELVLNWTVIPNQYYQLQYKTNLSQPGWINLGGAVSSPTTTASAADTLFPDPHRFYRLELLP